MNVLVSEAGLDAGVGGFGYFEFAAAGIRCWRDRSRSWCSGRYLLPQRNGATMPADFSRHAGLWSAVRAGQCLQVSVRPTSPYVGAAPQPSTSEPSPVSADCRAGPPGGAAAAPRYIEAGDVLLLRGDSEVVATSPCICTSAS